MIALSDTTAWTVTCTSGLMTGVLLGLEPSVSTTAFLSVTLLIALAILAVAVCSRLLRAPAH